MDSARTTKEVIREFVENNMSTHTDWTGTYVEIQYKCDTIDEFIERLWSYIEDNHYKC